VGAGFAIAFAAAVSVLAGGGSPGGTALGNTDGFGVTATLNLPTGLGVDAAGTTLFVGDVENRALRSVRIADGRVTSLAGGARYFVDGTGTDAGFINAQISAVAVDLVRGIVYATDTSNNVIRRVDVATAAVTTVAGGGAAMGTAAGAADGLGSAATFSSPWALALDASAASLVVVDRGTNLLRTVAVATGATTRLAGGGAAGGTAAGYADGAGSAALFNTPSGVALSAAGVAYVADTANGLIRAVSPAGAVTTVAGGAFPGGTANAGLRDGPATGTASA
jgi:sugar lactone lactonase YvrE